jgi:Spy/CpxP family protein refolding chaperone
MSPTLSSLGAATRRAGTIALVLLTAAVNAGQAQETQMPNPPTAITGMKPYEVVKQMLSHKHDLLLTEAQTQRLTKLGNQLKKGQPIREPTGRTKPPYNRVVQITTPEEAFAKAFSYLDGKQQHQCLMLFEREGKTGKPPQQ